MKKLAIIVFISFWIFACSSGGENVVPVLTSPPPVAATLALPANGTVCLEGQSVSATFADVSFSWSVAKDTDFYDLVVTNLVNFTSSTKTVNGDKTTMSLNKGVPYSWQIISKSNKVKETAASPVWKFYLAGDGASSYAPFPATAISPASGSSVSATGGKINLTWAGSDPDSKTLSYEIFIDTDLVKVTNRSVTAIKSTTPSLTVNANAGSTYYWCIKTSDGTQSSYSMVYGFRTN